MSYGISNINFMIFRFWIYTFEQMCVRVITPVRENLYKNCSIVVLKQKRHLNIACQFPIDDKRQDDYISISRYHFICLILIIIWWFISASQYKQKSTRSPQQFKNTMTTSASINKDRTDKFQTRLFTLAWHMLHLIREEKSMSVRRIQTIMYILGLLPELSKS